jgi:hypothetical protein
MVVVGNSSAAILAAYHVTWHFINPAQSDDTKQDNTTDLKYSDGSSKFGSGYELGSKREEPKTSREILEEKLRGKLKWRVVYESIYTEKTVNGEERPVRHLPFGTEDDDLRAVVDGAYYAGTN